MNNQEQIYPPARTHNEQYYLFNDELNAIRLLPTSLKKIEDLLKRLEKIGDKNDPNYGPTLREYASECIHAAKSITSRNEYDMVMKLIANCYSILEDAPSGSADLVEEPKTCLMLLEEAKKNAHTSLEMGAFGNFAGYLGNVDTTNTRIQAVLKRN